MPRCSREIAERQLEKGGRGKAAVTALAATATRAALLPTCLRLIAGLRRRVDAAEAEAEAAKAELQAVREGLAGGLVHEKGPDSAEALAKALGY